MSLEKIEARKVKLWKSNFFVQYDSKNLNISKDDFVVCWDIFTNNLPYKIRWKNVAYYSEYFGYKKGWKKNLIFYVVWILFFYNKRIIVPTKLAFETFSKISKNVFYLPSIFYWNINENKQADKKKIKILWISNKLNRPEKNIDFLVTNYLKLKNNTNYVYDMIWYDMIWYDMIWYDMIWYDMIWYDMICTWL
jgi:hypothetical protein